MQVVAAGSSQPVPGGSPEAGWVAAEVTVTVTDAGLDGPPAADAVRVVSIIGWRYRNAPRFLAERLGIDGADLGVIMAQHCEVARLTDGAIGLVTLATAGTAFDSTVNGVVGHVGAFGFIHRQPQRRIHIRIRATLARRHHDFAGNAGEDFATLGIFRAFFAFNG